MRGPKTTNTLKEKKKKKKKKEKEKKKKKKREGERGGERGRERRREGKGEMERKLLYNSMIIFTSSTVSQAFFHPCAPFFLCTCT